MHLLEIKKVQTHWVSETSVITEFYLVITYIIIKHYKIYINI